MMRMRAVAAAVVLLALPAATMAQRASPEALGMSSSRLARIDAVMEEAIAAGRTAGIAVLVLRDGQVVKAGTYGWADREAGTALRPDALFRIASQTKAITSVAAMMLVEEGRLRLGDPVHRWIPAFERATVATDSGAVPLRRPILVRDLLTHTTGISYGGEAAVRERYSEAGLGQAAGWGWYFADKAEPICTTMETLATLPFVAQPGDRFVYGYSTDVLGCVVERVSGMSLDDFFRTRIFEPLGMRDTHFFVPPAKAARLTTLYGVIDGQLVRAPEGARGQGHYVDGPRASFSGGAGLVSTIGDYARFLQMLLNGGELDGVRLLAPHTVALMTADHIDTVYGRPGMGLGFGFDVVEDRGLSGRYGAVGAYGWGGAYASTYWVDPAERIVALIMTQTLPAAGLDVADRFRALVYSAITAPSPAAR